MNARSPSDTASAKLTPAAARPPATSPMSAFSAFDDGFGGAAYSSAPDSAVVADGCFGFGSGSGVGAHAVKLEYPAGNARARP